MAIPTLYQGVGGTNFPLTADDVTDSFAPLDPARDRLLALFKAAINSEFSAAWTKVTATLENGHKLIGTSPVEDTLPLPPNGSAMTERKPGFPLLAFHRQGEPRVEQYRLAEFQRSQDWHLHYVMPPLDTAGQRKIGDIFLGVATLVGLVIRNRGHAAYDSGALQFFEGKGSLSSVELINTQGPAPAVFSGDESGATHLAMLMTLRTTEVTSDDMDAFVSLTGFSDTIDSGDGTGLVPALVEFNSDPEYQDG